MLENIILALIIAAIVGAAVVFVIKEKKRGVKCIGCPAAGQCSKGNCSGNCAGTCSGNCTGK